jgi:hypothetical protein
VLLENVFVVVLSVGVGLNLSSEEALEAVVRCIDQLLASVKLIADTKSSTNNVNGTIRLANCCDPLSEDFIKCGRDGVNVVNAYNRRSVNDLSEKDEARK